MTAMDPAAQVARNARHLADTGRRPTTAVLLGSGWNPLVERLADRLTLPYGELPGFPRVGVAGHAGVLEFGRLGGTEVVLVAGREHTYEHGRVDAMKVAVRTLAAVGVRTLVLTNAAGSLDLAIRPGELMLLTDHLNLVQRSPLVGETGSSRFVDLADAYDPALRQAALRHAAQSGELLHQGVYAWMLGPQFETPAEIRMLQRLGAQAVGMSTVPETLLARHAGLRVLGLSLITNMGCGLEAEKLSHAHTLATAQASAARAAGFLAGLVPALEAA